MKVKGVIHMHSTYSYDGKLSLSELKDFLVARNVTFCCMTEHTDEMTPESAQSFISECKELSDESFVFVPGFEVPYKNTHILHIGAEQFICQFAEAEELSAWRKVSPFVMLAHPVRNKFEIDEVVENVIDGVEVWNQQYDGKKAPRTRSMHLLQRLQEKKETLLAIGGLDLHRKEHFGSPLTTIEVEVLNSDNVIRALKQRSYIFGNDSVQISPAGHLMKGNMPSVYFMSMVSILIIALGKFVNKTLASFGLSLPSSIRQTIRSKF